MRGRRSGLSILEVMTVIPLLASLILLLGNTAHLAWRASDQARITALVVAREGRLEAELARRVRSGVPLEALCMARDGRLVEGTVEGALLRWAVPDALALRSGAGHVILARSGDRLVRYEVGPDGQVAREEFLTGVRATRFTVERDARGIVVGASWTVDTVTGQAVGFAGRRLAEPLPPIPPGPAAARRWQSKGGPR